MALRPRHTLGAIGLLALTFLVAFAAAGAGSADAAKRRAACDRHGKTAPTELQLEQARRTILCLINEKRRAAGLPRLERNARLDAAAQRHNEQMDGTGCFAHECPGEGDLGRRLEGVSYLIGGLLQWAFGENVAWGEGSRGTPKSIMAAWMASPGHRANILNRSYRDIGIGFSQGTPNAGDARGGIYTTDFGMRRN
jgi:uncharacterized protein YkwD